MTRIDRWEIKLQKFFFSRFHEPFKWGVNDCCSFAFDSIETITGVDICKWSRGRYKARGKAFKVLSEFAGGSIVETWDKLAKDNGLKEIPAAEINAGDVVTMKVSPLDPIAGRLSNGVTVGIKTFKEGFFSPGRDGLILSIEPEIVKAWRV